MSKIDVRKHSYGIASADMPQPCECCSSENEKPMYVIDIDGTKTTLCKDCMEKLYEDMGYILCKSVKLNDTVWELTRCNDDEWRIFPMVVKSIRPYGSIRCVKNSEPTIWNIYAEGDGTYMYKNFYELGKSWFITETAATAALACVQ